MCDHVPAKRSTTRCHCLVLLAISLGWCTGCYDGEALVKEARSRALRGRLAEVDLGQFHTMLPRDPDEVSLTELRLHMFGTAPRYRTKAIEEQLEKEGYRVRHETLAAIRQSTPAELAEPNLTSLRKRLESVMNGIFEESPVKSIGFYDFAVRRT